MRTSLFDIDNWKEIGSTLARNKTRTFLTAFGIFWGTAMLAMLMGGARGLQDILSRNFEGFASNTALIFPGRTSISYKGYNKGTSYNLQQADVDGILLSVPEITALTSVYSVNVVASNGKFSTSCQATGVDAGYPKIMLPVIYEGRFINVSDEKTERKICVLGKKVADQLFVNESPIGKYVSLSGIYYYVVGVAGQTNDIQINGKIDEMVLVPSNTLRRSFSLGDDIGGLMLLVKDGVSPSSLQPRIERIIRRNHPIHPDDHNAINFWDISEQFKMVDGLFMGIMLLAMFVGIDTPDENGHQQPACRNHRCGKHHVGYRERTHAGNRYPPCHWCKTSRHYRANTLGRSSAHICGRHCRYMLRNTRPLHRTNHHNNRGFRTSLPAFLQPSHRNHDYIYDTRHTRRTYSCH